MEAIWKPKTNYFVKLSFKRLKEVLDEILVNIIGYDSKKVWVLGDVCRGLKYLENDEIVINIQVCNPQWTAVKLKDGNIINALGVIDFVNTEDFDLAMYYFQIVDFPERLISQQEYEAMGAIEL